MNTRVRRYHQSTTCLAVQSYEKKIQSLDQARISLAQSRQHSERVNMASRISDPVVSRREMMLDALQTNSRIYCHSERKSMDTVFRARCENQDLKEAFTPNTSKVVCSQLRSSQKLNEKQNLDQKGYIMSLPEITRKRQNARRGSIQPEKELIFDDQ